MTRTLPKSLEVTPSAARLTGSLRDIGYDFHTAIADLVDNSVAANATRVDVEIAFDPGESYVTISDDGDGMSANGLVEALRYGTRRGYVRGDLGRFGLGLKTASLSQCRRLTVASRRSPSVARISTRTLDLDLIEEWDEWLIVDDEPTDLLLRATSALGEGPGTVVIWQKLDRVLAGKVAETGWGRRRMAALSQKTAQHLRMVFHRFISGLPDGRQLVLSVNGEKLKPWDPFAVEEPATVSFPTQLFELEIGATTGEVALRGFVLPPKNKFSSPAEFEELSGPLKWNRQQGLYIYRANRMVQFGGWSGLRAVDEHTKLARASLDFDTDLDEAFQINVAKMRVNIPPALKQMLERPVHELCVTADDTYRKTSRTKTVASAPDRRQIDLGDVGISLRAAAMEAGQLGPLTQAFEVLQRRNPDLWRALGLGR
ncbi:ATP-binding protein [Kribbella sp. NPDC050281]|uniref:ATP-binding protein n=1 Tax=Kribbella sp. NPDC050281 TaxID=3155515 RepID=UPI0033CEBFA6